jgi:hypothetical protein
MQMNRILTALTAIVFALTLTAVPDAQACISCNYTPESIAGTPSKSGPPKRASKPVVRERAAPSPKRPARVEREARRERPERPAQSRSKPRNEVRKNDVARQSEPSRTEPVAKAVAPNESAEKDDSSTAAVATGKEAEPVNEGEPAKPDEGNIIESAETKPAPPPSASAARALSEGDAATAARNEGPQPPKDCKKYLPSAGITVTVRCE